MYRKNYSFFEKVKNCVLQRNKWEKTLSQSILNNFLTDWSSKDRILLWKAIRDYEFVFEDLIKTKKASIKTEHTEIIVKANKRSYILVRHDLRCDNIFNRTLNRARLDRREIDFLMANHEYSYEEILLLIELLQKITNQTSRSDIMNRTIMLNRNFFAYLKNIPESPKTIKTLQDFFLIEAILKIPEFKTTKKIIAFLKDHAFFEDIYIQHKIDFFKQK